MDASPDRYEKVDGRHRLRSIWAYFDVEFGLLVDGDPINGLAVTGLKID